MAEAVTSKDQLIADLRSCNPEAQWCGVNGIMNLAADEIERLCAALERSADTFADFSKGLRLLNRPLLAEACEIAEKGAREALQGPQGECPTGDYEQAEAIEPKGSRSESPAHSTAPERPQCPHCVDGSDHSLEHEGKP